MLMHTLRAALCSVHALLQKFNDLLRECVFTITDTNLNNVHWMQASLPVRNGGMGVQYVSSLAPSAFLTQLRVPNKVTKVSVIIK